MRLLSRALTDKNGQEERFDQAVFDQVFDQTVFDKSGCSVWVVGGKA